MWKLVLLLFVFIPQRSVDASLTLCDSPQSYIEVEEGKQNNTFVCSGMRQGESVQWFLEYPNQQNNPTLIGACFTNLLCDVQLKTIFNLGRTTETSVITVNETAIFNKNSFSTATLLCRTFLQESKTDESRCQVDYIYPAENITCKIEFSGNTWMLTGQCAISKVNSTRNNYGCSLYQTLEGSQDSTIVGFYSMDLAPSTANRYASGTCNLTSFLPPGGRYTYTVMILPGKVKVPATFIGNNAIRQPPVSPTHNCPFYVNEGGTLSCKCVVDDFGSPAGKLAWNTSSDQLLLTGVKKEQHGMTYVCGVTWNNTVFQPVTYTLLVSYPPSQLRFKLNNITSDIVTVEENTSVTMLCQSDGRPTPNVTITDVTNENRVVHSLQGRNVALAELGYTITLAQCEDSGDYRCTADNGVGRTSQSVRLFVKCKPRNTSADASFKPPTIFEGQNAIFQLIAYPTPVNVTKYFLGSNMCSGETPTSDDVFRVDCSSSSQWIYKVTCTVTVLKVTSYAAGLYKAVVSNELGGVELIFEALPRNTTESEKNDDLISAEFTRGQKSGLGIGLGVAAAEAVIFATLVLVFFWRRKRVTSNARGERNNTAYSSRQDISSDKATELNSLRSPSGHDKNEQESAYEAISSSETGQTAAYTNVEGSVLSRKTSNKPGNVYDGLRSQDVGVNSPYASLS